MAGIGSMNHEKTMQIHHLRRRIERKMHRAARVTHSHHGNKSPSRIEPCLRGVMDDGETSGGEHTSMNEDLSAPWRGLAVGSLLPLLNALPVDMRVC